MVRLIRTLLNLSSIVHPPYDGPVRWLMLVLVWAGWCWFSVRGKHCWLAGLGWLKPTSEQAEYFFHGPALVAHRT